MSQFTPAPSRVANPSAAARNAPFVIAPDQVVAMLIKADHVNLRGFGGVSQKLPFWLPTTSAFESQVMETDIRTRNRFLSNLQWAFLAILGLTALLLVAITWVSQPNSRAQGIWMVELVSTDSVRVRVGASGKFSAATLTVPINAMLPNGEMLRSVDPALQSFSTDTQITVVKK